MADITRQYLDYAGLTEVVSKLKGLIQDASFSGTAADVTVADAGGHLTATNVEDALAELAVAIELLNDSDATKAGTIAKMISDAVGGELKIGETTYSTVKAYVNALNAAVLRIIQGETGSLADLKTTDKSNLVAAINELHDEVDGLGTAAQVDVATKAIGADGETEADKALIPTVGAVETYVTSKVASLEGATHFLGKFNATSEVENPAAGDIILVGYKEYIYDKEGNWVEIGDENIYVVKEDGKSLVANTDIAKLQAIDISEDENHVVSVTDGADTLKISAIPLTGDNSIAKLFE